MPLIRPGLVALLLSACTAGLLVGAATSPAAAAPGEIREFAFPDAAATPQSLASDADGTLWITLRGTALLAKSTLDGAITTVLAGGSSPSTGPDGIALGPDKRLWLAETTGNRISAVTAATGAVASFPLPQAGSAPRSIVAGPDGALWFTEFAGNRIGRITTTGTITEYTLAGGSAPDAITNGPDGALWFTMRTGNAIGRITTQGAVSSYPLPSTGAGPQGITQGSDGNLWFTETTGNRIGRITPKGLIAEFLLPAGASGPGQIVAGADTNLWFTEIEGNRISRITTAGTITSYPIPTPGALPAGITSGVDGNIWFAESAGNRLGRVLTGVVPTSVAAPRVSGTSTTVGQQLTASTGSWNWLPTSFAYQWQRCATADAASCASIAGATAATYTLTADDAGTRLRVQVSAANLNGTSSAPSSSNLLAIDGLPPAPAPPAVSGGQTVLVAPGVTATLKHPTRPKRGSLRSYAVRFSSPAIRGTVRISLVDPSGTVVRVIAARRTVKANGVAKRLWRLPYAVAPGQYSVVAVFSPSPDQAGTVAAATLRRAITVRR